MAALLPGFGLLALGALWLGPLPRLASGSFSAHMMLHMGVVAIAAPAIALGLAGRRLDPVRRFPKLFPPVPWSAAELAVVWAWHAPALHHGARESPAAFAIEQASFLACGLGLWLSAFGGRAAERANRRAAGVVALLLTSMHMTLLGALLALPPRALYTARHGLYVPEALQDQHRGGAIMLLVGGIVYLLGGLWLSRDLLGAIGVTGAKGRSGER